MLEIFRSRLRDLIETATQHRVALIVGAAGSGKSTVIRDFLSTTQRPYRAFDLRESTDEFTRWLARESSTFEGFVAVDGLESASRGVIEPLVARISSTGDLIAWILASCSTAGLPIGKWLAYDVAAPIVSHADLHFHAEEIGALAKAHDITIGPREREEILELTQGWAIATAFAVRAFGHASDSRTVRGETRAMMLRFLDEHVTTTLGSAEIALLEAAALLPAIDAAVLEKAGFDRPLRTIDGIKERTSLLWEVAGGRFSCDELLVGYFKRRVNTMERSARDQLYGRLAATFETLGDVAEALNAYAKAGLRADVLRLLERNGFDLIDRAKTEAVAQAIESLDERTRRNNPRILALRGVVHASKGRPARAESLLHRSITCTGGDRDAEATTSLRLAVLVANRGDEVNALVGPIANDPLQSAEHRAEALSLLAAQRALAGDAQAAKAAAAGVQELLPQIGHDITRAKVLQRIGVAAVNTGDVERARVTLEEAADLAKELELHSVASRACANLCNLVSHSFDDLPGQLKFAKEAVEAATRSGDTLDLQTSLLQLLRAEMQRGNDLASTQIEGRLMSLRTGDDSRAHYVISFKAVRLSWQGHFWDAYRTLAPLRRRFHYQFDRLTCDAYCALFLAMDGRRETSYGNVREALSTASEMKVEGMFAARVLALSGLYCSIAEAVNGRHLNAERIAKQIHCEFDSDLTVLLKKIARTFVTSQRSGTAASTSGSDDLLERLARYGHLDACRLLRAVDLSLQAQGHKREALSPAEVEVLRLLGEGLNSKEIAVRTDRSVFTVRVHIANAIAKLRCHGRLEAVASARRRGIIA